MVFIYLPFYFGIGVILFFVWRLAACRGSDTGLLAGLRGPEC